MASKVQIVGGSFQDVIGNPLANGYLVFRLSQDSQVNDASAELVAGYTVTVKLDSTGSVPVSPISLIWPNDVLLPANSYYAVSVYTALGELVWGPNTQQVLSNPSPFNISAWIPNQVTSWSPSNPGNESIQHNGAIVGTRPTINLVDGTNVTLTVTDSVVNNRVDVTVASTGTFPYGGDGSDGALVFDGSSTVAGLVPASNTYTLTRDLFATTIVVNNGVTVQPFNFRLLATVSITVNGTVNVSGNSGGNAANGGTAGGATLAGGQGLLRVQISGSLTVPGAQNGALSAQGAAGGTGVGSNASVPSSGNGTSSNGGFGSVFAPTTAAAGGGGTGASGGGGTGSTGYTASSFVQDKERPRHQLWRGYWNTAQWSNTDMVAGAGGGGGGGGDGTNFGGSGGGGGGSGAAGSILLLVSPTIVIGGTGVLNADGGNGGNGGNGGSPSLGNTGGGGGGAGGPGGHGGIVAVICHTYTNNGSVHANAGVGGNLGTHGTGHGTGTNGTDGVNGPAGVNGLVLVFLA